MMFNSEIRCFLHWQSQSVSPKIRKPHLQFDFLNLANSGRFSCTRRDFRQSVAQICDCSVDTELIDRNNSAKNYFDGLFTFRWSELISFLFLCLSTLLFPRHWWHEIQDVSCQQSWASCLQQFYPILHPVCEYGFHTISSRIQAPLTTNVLAGIFEHTLQWWQNSQYNSRFPVLSMNCHYLSTRRWSFLWNWSGSHLNSAIMFWISARIPNVVNPGKNVPRIPLGLRQFDPNLWDSVFPKTIWSCPPRIRLVWHWCFPDRGLSRKKRRFWNSQSEQLYHITELFLSTWAASSQSWKDR